MIALWTFSAAFIVSLILGWPSYWLLIRIKMIDHPNDRSSHTKPTARGGGIAIMATILGGGLWCAWSHDDQTLPIILACALVLAIISFIDDLRPLGAAKRFSFHFVAAGLALFALRISGASLALGSDMQILLPNVVTWIIGFFWISGYTNAFNFMDGINGIASLQAAITGCGMALLAGKATGDFGSTPVIASLLVSGAALGFLPHNFPKARMFMGDVSSAPLGFLLAALGLWLARDAGWWLLIPIMLLHTNYILDTGITLARRILRGERWYDAHREHFYQRLIRSGRSHRFVTLSEMGLQLVVLILMLLYVTASPGLRIGLIFSVLAIWLSFFRYCEVSLHRSVRAKELSNPIVPPGAPNDGNRQPTSNMPC